MAFSRDGKPFSLDPKDRSFFGAPTHSGVPVLDQDINIQQNIQAERIKNLQQAIVTDGWATRGDFAEVGGGSLYLIMGDSKAIVDGNVLQVKEFFTTDNRIPFTAANPASGRYDLVWLEVWYELVGSTDTIYKYGNVNYYGSELENDLIDPVIGSITSSRVQVRYRIRVTPNASAMSSATVLAQGAMASPGAGKTFTEDTEKKHWYCNTGTDYSIVGGYVYALPIVKVWRAAGDDAINLGDLTDQRILGVVNTDVILTTQGDLIVRGSSEVERLAAVAAGQVLKSAGVGAKPEWGQVGGVTTQGDLVVRGASIPERLAAGADKTVLRGKGAGVPPEYDIENPELTTQGDLLVRGAAIQERLAAGVVGTILKGKGGGILPAYEDFRLDAGGFAAGSFSRSTGGNEVITGVGFEPSLILVLMSDATPSLNNHTVGFSDGTFNYCCGATYDGINSTLRATYCLSNLRDASNSLSGAVSAKSSDGFTITFTLTGAVSLQVAWLAIK